MFQKVTSRVLSAFLCVCSLGLAAPGQNTRLAPIPEARVRDVLAQVRSEAASDDSIAEALVLGKQLTRESRFAEAAEVFAAVLNKRPREELALYGASLAAFNTGRVEEAESFIRSTLEVALPSAPVVPAALSLERRMEIANALVLAAVVVAVRGKDSESLKFAQQATNIAPDHFDAQFTLGRALFGAGDYLGAVKAFRKATALNPNDARSLFFLGTSLERAGDVDEALRIYRELISKAPAAPEGHVGAGILLVRRGGPQTLEGIKELEQAIAIKPDQYEARIELGKALVSKQRYADALLHLLSASALAPNNPEPHYQLALAYRRLGRRDDAAREEAIVKTIHEQRRTSKSQNDVPTP